MAVEITIPRLGWNMEEGVFAGWLKHDGDTVKAGESVFSLESEKATQDIECLDSGILRISSDAPREGDTVLVGTVIAYLVQPGEKAPFDAKQLSTGGLTAANRPEPKDNRPDLTSRTDRPGAEQPDQGLIRSRRPASSPRARRTAAALGVDWQALRGTGRAGRIREADVRSAVEMRKTSVPFSATTVQLVRRTIAQRMMESRLTTAPVTLTTRADATNLVSLRNQFKASTKAGTVAPGYTDLITKLTALALREHPALNARWEENRVLHMEHINIGIAVDTPAGLFVPVLHDVPILGIREIAVRAHDLIERAKAHRLQREEMQGSTFTITNLGQFGIDAFTPIINFPEAAILGLGRIEARPTVREEQIVIRDEITLNLTFDHRVVDGAPAARFLQQLCQMIETAQAFLQ